MSALNANAFYHTLFLLEKTFFWKLYFQVWCVLNHYEHLRVLPSACSLNANFFSSVLMYISAMNASFFSLWDTQNELSIFFFA